MQRFTHPTDRLSGFLLLCALTRIVKITPVSPEEQESLSHSVLFCPVWHTHNPLAASFKACQTISAPEELLCSSTAAGLSGSQSKVFWLLPGSLHPQKGDGEEMSVLELYSNSWTKRFSSGEKKETRVTQKENNSQCPWSSWNWQDFPGCSRRRWR